MYSQLQYNIEEYKLVFKKPATTSRNVFKERLIYLIHLKDIWGNMGIGEAAPLSLLSIDDVPNYKNILEQKTSELCEPGSSEKLDLLPYPSIKFGLETALLSLQAKGKNPMLDTAFTRGESTIPVNGLVWMDDTEAMFQQALEKIEAGFNTIKFKVGALDFDDECRMLEKLRKQFSAFKITLRLDANGGFKTDEAMQQIKDLSRFEIHSIEQPIQPNQWHDMEKLCLESDIDIALDEELIGINLETEAELMLTTINPQYIILKPNLIGGLANSDRWIELANAHNIGWWATSALESNIGLNAISQWVSTYEPIQPQGLGTGGLFENNLEAPLSLVRGQMHFKL
jgi:o-succinylbenzoate synthase